MGIIWKGADGALYDFSEHPYDSDWADIGGIFIYAARLRDGNWNPLYVAATDNLARRVRGDEKWPWAVRLGATTVLACAIPEPEKRPRLVAEMIARLKPPLNDYPQNQFREAERKRRAS